VMADTLQRAAVAGLSVAPSCTLPVLQDIDTVEDLRNFSKLDTLEDLRNFSKTLTL
jgi:hypothetical protein